MDRKKPLKFKAETADKRQNGRRHHGGRTIKGDTMRKWIEISCQCCGGAGDLHCDFVEEGDRVLEYYDDGSVDVVCPRCLGEGTETVRDFSQE